MWPWEHLAVGYVAYSLLKRARGSPPPDRVEVLVLAFATQLPDLVDKPLGWGTEILPSGVSFAHSYLVGVPLVVLVYLLARRRGVPRFGVAFATGYLLHTPCDILARYMLNGEVIVGALLWPLTSVPPSAPQSVLGRVVELGYSFLATIQTPAGQAYLALEILVVGGALLVWLADRRSNGTADASGVLVE